MSLRDTKENLITIITDFYDTYKDSDGTLIFNDEIIAKTKITSYSSKEKNNKIVRVTKIIGIKEYGDSSNSRLFSWDFMIIGDSNRSTQNPWLFQPYILTDIINDIKKQYPEYFEGDNMGFFDLKTENKHIYNFKQFEKIVLDIEQGDLLLGGKFKNKQVTVKDIGKDDKNQVTINGKPLLKFRIWKHLPKNLRDKYKKKEK